MKAVWRDDLWEAGEKVLVFAFYRRTCRALRIHISQDIERRTFAAAQRRLGEAGREADRQAIERLLEGIQKRFVDDPKSPGRKALDRALAGIIEGHAKELDAVDISGDQRDLLTDVMRRFLRVTTTLVRCFPIEELANLKPAEVVTRALEQADVSGTSWRQKFDGFINFLVECSAKERLDYLEAARRTTFKSPWGRRSNKVHQRVHSVSTDSCLQRSLRMGNRSSNHG